MELILKLIATFVGTVAFSVLFHVPKKQLWICGLVGMAGYTVYISAEMITSAAAASFLAGAVIALLARFLAVIRKVPSNTIMIPGIFPIIPGVSIYDMIYSLFVGNTFSGLTSCFVVLKIIFAMVLGMVAVFSLPHSVFNLKRRGKHNNLSKEDAGR